MDILRCCVIDDEPLASQLIASYVEKTPSLQLVGAYSSAQDAIKTILNGQVDIVFLDIQMPQINGLEFAKILTNNCRVIFTTAYEQYAIQGFKVDALDYLLKPVSYDDFLASIEKAQRLIKAQRCCENKDSKQEYIIVKSEYRLIQIPTDDILYV